MSPSRPSSSALYQFMSSSMFKIWKNENEAHERYCVVVAAYLSKKFNREKIILIMQTENCLNETRMMNVVHFHKRIFGIIIHIKQINRRFFVDWKLVKERNWHSFPLRSDHYRGSAFYLSTFIQFNYAKNKDLWQ